jgi:hypothetical protein
MSEQQPIKLDVGDFAFNRDIVEEVDRKALDDASNSYGLKPVQFDLLLSADEIPEYVRSERGFEV